MLCGNINSENDSFSTKKQRRGKGGPDGEDEKGLSGRTAQQVRQKEQETGRGRAEDGEGLLQACPSSRRGQIRLRLTE